MPPEPRATGPPHPPDELARFGYHQELNRELGWFSSFALSFSIVAVTTGLFATYGVGLQTAGPAFIWTWPVVGLGQFLLAMVFAKLARRIPLSGSAYQWTRELGGNNLAWWAGWLMIIQVTAGLAAVCYALASYALPAVGIAASDRNVLIATSLVLFSIAIINHSGVKTTSVVNNVMVVAEIVVILVVGFLLLSLAIVHKTNSFHFLFTHPGLPGGAAFLGPLAASSLMAAWTITGFEGAANLAEETKLPEKRVPFAILSSEIFSVVIGFLILLGFTLGIPSLEAATREAVPFAYIMDHHFPHPFTTIVMFIIVAEIYACALANSAMLMRVVWAMARDRQLPGSSWLSKISVRKVPANSLWLMTVLTALCAWWAKLVMVIAGISGIAAYITYVMVVGCALLGSSHHRTSESRIVPRVLAAITLIWILICLGALTIPQSTRTNVKAMLVMGLVGLGFWWATRKSRRLLGSSSSKLESLEVSE
jgi:amino acid transporter